MSPAPGEETLTKIVNAAMAEFGANGYERTHYTAIAARAGLSVGSLSNHAGGKRAIAKLLWQRAEQDMVQPPHVPQDTKGQHPFWRIWHTNLAYLTYYRDHAPLMALFHELETRDEEFQALQQQRSRKFEERNAKGIRRLQEKGHARADLDPDAAAISLSLMVSATARYLFCLSGQPADVEQWAIELTKYWAGALGITVPADLTPPPH